MTLVSMCLGYNMKPENVKVNPEVIASEVGEDSAQANKQNGKMIHVTMTQKGLTFGERIDDRITLKYLYFSSTNQCLQLHKVFYLT